MALKDMYPELISGSRRPSANLAAWAIALAGVAAALAPSQASAQEWTGGLSGGAVIRDGEQSNRLRLSLTKESRPLSHNIYADYFFGGGEDAWEVGYRPRYWFGQQLYVFGELNYRVDEFIGIERETGEALGVGYQLTSKEHQSAYVEVSAGARQVTFTDEVALSGDMIDDLSQGFGRARLGYNQTLTDSLRFQFAASTTLAETYTEASAEAGVTVRLGTLALTVGYRLIEQRVDGQPDVSDDTTTFSFSYAL